MAITMGGTMGLVMLPTDTDDQMLATSCDCARADRHIGSGGYR